MKAWILAALNVLCGLCGAEIRAGQPALELSGRDWTALRCPKCAGEPMPAVIEAMRPGTVIRVDFAQRVNALKPQARDFKIAQGERE